MLPSPFLPSVMQDVLWAQPRKPLPRPEPPRPRARDASARPAVTIRWAGPADRRVLEALAVLDEAPVPEVPVLVAEREGIPVAALPMDGSRAIADPFAPTAELVDLLEVRAAQLARSARPRRRLLPRVARALRRA
jgi:hypothetical protein